MLKWNCPLQYMWTILEQSGYQSMGQPVTGQSTLTSGLLLCKNIRRMGTFVTSELQEGSKSELTAKAKRSDRIFTKKLGLSQSLMVQEGTYNPNLTLKGYPRKFWGLFSQKAHKIQQITLFHPPKEVYP